MSVWTVFLAVIFPPFLAFVAVQLLVDRYRRRGAPVTATSQPEVDALVAGVASRLGVPLPDRVWLTAEPIVRATVAAGRSHLSVGLPLVECLALAEVAALVGHELALLRRPRARLVIGLLAQWSEAVREESFQDGRELRRATALRGALDAFAVEVQRDADVAAITAAGGADPAARAFALARLVDEEYEGFVTGSGAPPRRWWRLYEVAIQDMHDGWRRAVRHGLGETSWDAEEAAVLARAHPTLAGSLAMLGAGPLPVMSPADAVPVTPLSAREQRRTVRHLRGISSVQLTRWTTYQRSPDTWWRRRAAEDVRSVRADVATVLGREPADDDEVCRTIMHRPAELLAAALGISPDQACPTDPDPSSGDPTDPPGALVWLLEEHLLRRGWRLDHPAVRGVLVGPAGEVVNLREALRAGPDPSAVSELLRDDRDR